MQIELNKEEAQVLVNLLDVAIKATGLQGAEACVLFAKRINDAANAPPVAAPAWQEGDKPPYVKAAE